MIERLTRALRFCEDAVLVLALSAMIGLAAYQVIARNFFDTGLLWGDSFVRVLVLWVTFVGAMVASRQDEHIRMDLLARYLNPARRAVLVRFRSLFAAVIAGLFTYFSAEFVLLDYDDGITAFAKVPAWVCELIMPVGGAVICLRYVLHTISPPPERELAVPAAGEPEA